MTEAYSKQERPLSSLTSRIIPFYFGPPDKQLFGCYHAPQSQVPRSCAVVLCYPAGQEYIRSHRSFLQLANRIARAGFHVLRFDFYGCGDSAGSDTDVRLPQLSRDIHHAVDLMRAKYGVTEIVLVGLRLGAALALLTAAERSDIDKIVLWEPTVVGKDFMKELRLLHRKRIQSFPAKIYLPSANGHHSEISGFALPEPLCEELEAFDLRNTTRKPTDRVFFVAHEPGGIDKALVARLREMSVVVDTETVPGPRIWFEDVNKVLVPHQVLQSIVTWLAKVHP